MNDLTKNIILWIVIAVVLATVVSNFSGRPGAVQEVPYSTFLTQVEAARWADAARAFRKEGVEIDAANENPADDGGEEENQEND